MVRIAKRKIDPRQVAAKAQRPIEPMAYSIAEFCEAHGISVDMYFRMGRDGFGPQTMKVGARPSFRMKPPPDGAWSAKPPTNPRPPPSPCPPNSVSASPLSTTAAGAAAPRSPRAANASPAPGLLLIRSTREWAVVRARKPPQRLLQAALDLFSQAARTSRLYHSQTDRFNKFLSRS